MTPVAHREFRSGVGSILWVIQAFEQASGRPMAHKLVARRPGDAAATVDDPSLANRGLGWRTKRSLEESCHDD